MRDRIEFQTFNQVQIYVKVIRARAGSLLAGLGLVDASTWLQQKHVSQNALDRCSYWCFSYLAPPFLSMRTEHKSESWQAKEEIKSRLAYTGIADYLPCILVPTSNRLSKLRTVSYSILFLDPWDWQRWVGRGAVTSLSKSAFAPNLIRRDRVY